MKGIIGTSCKDEFLLKMEKYKVTKEKNKTKLLKEIINILNSNKNYKDVAIELEMHTIDVLKLLQENTLQFGTTLNISMAKHLKDNGVRISEIAELYDCEEYKVILILNNIDENVNDNIINQINLSIKIDDLLSKGKEFIYVSKILKIDKYKGFLIYNKYFKRYENKIINFKVIEELNNLGLSSDDISRFYKVNDDNMKMVIEEVIRDKNSRRKEEKNLNSEDILTNAYKNSTNNDFYSIRSNNRRYL